ncbi:hypothetical protein BGZ63DRAFT_465255 [Mariannaea sp. PMI_226]|nr:hypothetical protein BGZ63DRAFT_465255 [Mariannaea sp. PMI_226]
MTTKIGDLLAQISGGEPSSNPTPILTRTNTLPKRKPDNDLSPDSSKQPRTTLLSSTVAPRTVPVRPRPDQTSAPFSRSTQPSRPLDRPNTSQRSANDYNSRPSVLSSKPLNGNNRVQKPSRPSPTTPTSVSAASRAAPKKGSFAEILARGQRAQATMGQVGRIQHKKVEKTSIVVKKQEPKTEARTPSKNLPPKPAGYSGTSGTSGYAGSSKPTQRNGTPVNGSKDGRNVKPPALTKAERAKIAAEEEREKRIKKLAAATTGYTGTARPKPGNASKKHNAPRGGALLNTKPSRPAHSKSRFDDEFDEDLDDFIDYDDEEEDDQGPRYDYASDASSDMEAGLDDIDVEERRAEVIARREDIEEERLERNLKMAKEKRKREALDSLRAGRRR